MKYRWICIFFSESPSLRDYALETNHRYITCDIYSALWFGRSGSLCLNSKRRYHCSRGESGIFIRGDWVPFYERPYSKTKHTTYRLILLTLKQLILSDNKINQVSTQNVLVNLKNTESLLDLIKSLRVYANPINVWIRLSFAYVHWFGQTVLSFKLFAIQLAVHR